MIFCLAKIAKLTHWELKSDDEFKPIHYTVTLNPKTKLLDARYALASTITQLSGLNKRFTFTVKGGSDGGVLYEHKNY